MEDKVFTRDILHKGRQVDREVKAPDKQKPVEQSEEPEVLAELNFSDGINIFAKWLLNQAKSLIPHIVPTWVWTVLIGLFVIGLAILAAKVFL